MHDSQLPPDTGDLDGAEPSRKQGAWRPAATLVIPTLERPEQLEVLVSCLESQTRKDFEVLILDQSDQPDHRMQERDRLSDGRIRYVYLTRKSLPNARNEAARRASSPVLIFIDDDVELSDRFVEAHLARLEVGDVAAVAGRITGGYDDGPPDATPTGAWHAWNATVTRNFHVNRTYDSIEQLPGGNFSVRREIYTEVGGFHPDAFGGPASIGEESDFACRLRKAGHAIAFEPQAHLIHLHLPRGGCRDTSITRWTYWHGHNMALLMRRHSRWWFLPTFVLLQVLRYTVHAVRKKAPSLIWFGVTGTLKGLFSQHARM